LLVPVPEAGIISGQMNPEGYQRYGILAALIMMTFIFISARGTHRHIPNLHKPSPPKPFSFSRTIRELRETLFHRPFLALFFAAIITAMAQGVITTLNLYFWTYFWFLQTIEIAMITAAWFLAAAFALFLAPIISRRRNKRNVVILLSIISTCYLPLPIALKALGLFWPTGHDMVVPTLIFHAISEGTIIIMISILVSSMVADVVESSEMDTGRRSEGLFFSARSFAGKVVSGIGVFIGATLITIVGIPRGAAPEEVDPQIMTNFALFYVPTIMFIYFVSVGVLAMYKITREEHGERVETLRQRRATTPAD
jgi:Na+/melibiose symporter-like transporter